MTGLWQQIADNWRAHSRAWTKPGFRAIAVHCFGVKLPDNAKVGRGAATEDQRAIAIHGNSLISKGCIIRQGCTLGLRPLTNLSAAPVLEEQVELGSGAVALGAVRPGSRR